MSTKSDGFLRGQLATARRDRDDLLQALKNLVALHPTFRSKPIGAPGSEMRFQQDAAIAAEDAAMLVIVRVEGRQS